MIALPVLAVTAADVVLQTQDVSGAESLDRRLGAADARVTFQQGIGAGVPGASTPTAALRRRRARRPPPRPSRTGARALGAGLRRPGRSPMRDRAPSASTPTRAPVDAETTRVDLTDPLADGLFDGSTGGREPPGRRRGRRQRGAGRPRASPSATALDGATAPTGLATPVGRRHRRVRRRTATTRVAGRPSADLAPSRPSGTRTWLVDGGPVTWDAGARAQRARRAGALAGRDGATRRRTPRSPPRCATCDQDARSTWLAIVVLIVVMALIEVVLLGGPGLRRRRPAPVAPPRADGRDRRHPRAGAPGGAGRRGRARRRRRRCSASLLGIGVAWLLVPAACSATPARGSARSTCPGRTWSASPASAWLSALLAAVVPAWIASRQDVVAVLAGRRGRPGAEPALADPRGRAARRGRRRGGVRRPRRRPNGEYFIAGAAIVAVLGMILLVPVVVVGLARLSRRLPLTLRYAVRDAARHRTRTVPAVAAVAATVAGVVALGIANTSDDAAERGRVHPVSSRSARRRHAVEGPAGRRGRRCGRPWSASVPGRHHHRACAGMPVQHRAAAADRRPPLRAGRSDGLLDSYGSSLGSSRAGQPTAGCPRGLPGLRRRRRRPGRRRAAGRRRAVVFTSHRGVAATGCSVIGSQLRRTQGVAGPPAGPGDGAGGVRAAVPEAPGTVQAVRPAVGAARPWAPSRPPGHGRAGRRAARRSPSSSRPTSTRRVRGDLRATPGFYVERGYQAPDETVILLLVLGGLGGVLMLGGTLTATFLALSDARPDLATLSAVGASPRTRRGVAAAYAAGGRRSWAPCWARWSGSSRGSRSPTR